MTYQSFKTMLLPILQEKMGNDVELTMHEVIKNNHVVLDGLCIQTKTCHVAPTIYLNNFFHDLLTSDDLPAIADEICQLYHSNEPDDALCLLDFTDFTSLKENIAYKLVHFSRNSQLLKEIPHIPYLDLAIVFYCMITSSDEGHATFLIRDSHLSLWGIQTKDLYELALANTPQLLPEEFLSLSELLQGLVPVSEAPGPDDSCNMYVLSNHHKLFGAACILYHNLLSSLSEKFHSSLFILPSSIHEGATCFAI